MNEIDQPITFHQLVARYDKIEIPLIQRDYAQGRYSEKEVRANFLKALQEALAKPPGYPPLNLDFVYGSMEAGEASCFLPLDGQQRLTTLFLLHWYLAWRDSRLSDFQTMLWDGKHARFTYVIRPSSSEFFDALVNYVPSSSPGEEPSMKRMLENQPWFFLYWRLDPTIQSTLVMLDAIHELFKSTTGLYARLFDEKAPAITFQLLPLEHFGLSDDLYIKMNARGKPLTPFETFKARFEELLKELFPTEKRKIGGGELGISQFFERRIDTQWTDFFWVYKNNRTNTFDDAVMNLIWALARISLDPASASFTDDTTLLRTREVGGSYQAFHEHGWLTREFASNLICLLETWSSGGGQLTPALDSKKFFDESAFFSRAISTPASLEYAELIQFAALVFYLQHHDGNLDSARIGEWMRVVYNLATNSELERPEEYGRCLAGVRKLVPHGPEILEYLSVAEIGQIGFSPQQVREEVLKAQLILSDPGWRTRIDTAEEHGYFLGQIEFLLDFAGVLSQTEKEPVKNWDASVHPILQSTFDVFLKKAAITFTEDGLASTKMPVAFLWKRALLSVGDYLSSLGSNQSFLTDPPRNGDSWKRFLRDGKSGKRQFLKALWELIDDDQEIESQLKQIIENSKGLEPWRAAMVASPEVMRYCRQQEFRMEDQIYLLRKRQMNGTHAELFTFVLSLELETREFSEAIAPLKPLKYQDVLGRDQEPHVLLSFERSKHRLNFVIESHSDRFRIQVSQSSLKNLPEVEAALRGKVGFVNTPTDLIRLTSRSEIHNTLQEIAQILNTLPADSSEYLET